MQKIRQSAVAGAFYPAQRDALLAVVRKYLSLAAPHNLIHCPKAIVVPHAGYIYSGAAAASAYATLAADADVCRITRVVILGPAHTLAVRGLALPGVDLFNTPIGPVKIDHAAIAAITSLRQVEICPAAHASEHSLEVQLPFLQAILGDFQLVPLVVGHATAKEVAEVLDILWGGPETLIVISTDLSHYLPYDAACTRDAQTVERILSLLPLQSHQQACGATPVNGLIVAAKRHQLHPKLIRLCNSGDTSGDKSRVVGYASFAFYGDELYSDVE